MKVIELIKQLSEYPQHLNIYKLDGTGLASVKQIDRLNLIGLDQFVELRFYDDTEDYTPNLQDALIERETGFQDRQQLIDAYKALKKKTDDERMTYRGLFD